MSHYMTCRTCGCASHECECALVLRRRPVGVHDPQQMTASELANDEANSILALLKEREDEATKLLVIKERAKRSDEFTLDLALASPFAKPPLCKSHDWYVAFTFRLCKICGENEDIHEQNTSGDC